MPGKFGSTSPFGVEWQGHFFSLCQGPQCTPGHSLCLQDMLYMNHNPSLYFLVIAIANGLTRTKDCFPWRDIQGLVYEPGELLGLGERQIRSSFLLVQSGKEIHPIILQFCSRVYSSRLIYIYIHVYSIQCQSCLYFVVVSAGKVWQHFFHTEEENRQNGWFRL